MMIWIIVQIIISVSFIFPFILFLIAKTKRATKFNAKASNYDYAFIVTAYKQIDLIPNVVNSILNVDHDRFLIYVVADGCDVSNLHFDDERVCVLRPKELLSSNTKSHFYAINRFKRPHDILTIIDSDNLVREDYIEKLDPYFDAGYKAVQGVRAAKNLNTIYACLDEAGDLYYRFIDRKLLFEAGSSASLAGSGMAFKTDIYKYYLENNQVEGAGFDKVLQYLLINNGERIAFAEDAVVYDEKTSKSDQLVKQRARWINTWFRFWALGVKLFFRSLASFNWNSFAFSVLLLRPPLFLLLIICALCFVIDLFVMPLVAIYWVGVAAIFLFLFFTALRYFRADERIIKSLKHAPKFMFFQILAFLKVRKANKISVATEHYANEALPKGQTK